MGETGDKKAAQKPQSDRDARLKAALKANLGRRKAQARARAETPDPETDAEASSKTDENRGGDGS
ncbi:MAG: hypothetical protein AAGD04_17170 [Pseudomonadota bacterium]